MSSLRISQNREERAERKILREAERTLRQDLRKGDETQNPDEVSENEAATPKKDWWLTPQVPGKFSEFLTLDQILTIQRELPNLPQTNADTTEALETLLEGHSYRLVGVGETHPSAEGRSPAPLLHSVFAKDIVPELVREHGFSVIGTEYLPMDAETEIQAFMQTGYVDATTMPILSTMIFGFGDDSILTLLESVYSLRQEGYDVSLHGTHVLFETLVFLFTTPLSPEFLSVFIDTITANSRQLAKNSFEQGKKVILYNGGAHNDFVSNPQTEIPDTDLRYFEGLGIPQDDMLSLEIISPDHFPFIPAALSPNSPLAINPPTDGVSLIHCEDGTAQIVLSPFAEKTLSAK